MTPEREAPESAAEGVLAALADPTRRQILDLLSRHGSGTATSLAAELPVSRQAVVKHLGILDRAGLIEGQRVGREMRYSVRPGRLDETARWLASLASDWDRRLHAVKRLAESVPQRSTASAPLSEP